MKVIRRTYLTKEKQFALKELRGDSEIIIFEAAKGGAVVVMDCTYYAEKIVKMLNDSPTYKEIPANTDNDNNNNNNNNNDDDDDDDDNDIATTF